MSGLPAGWPSSNHRAISWLRPGWERLPEGLRAALFAYACFRVPLELFATLAAGSLPPGPGATGMPPLDGPAWAQAWLRWDSGWYVRIIRDGYSYSPCVADGDPCAQASIAFFPLFPIATRGVMQLGLPLSIASFLLTHLALLFALWGLHRLAGKLLGPKAQLPATVALLVFPFSIFLSAGYAESLLICLAVWAYVWFEDDRALLAGLFVGLTILTRSHGVLLGAALVTAALLQRRWKMAGSCAGLGAVALGGYMSWLGLTYGDPLAFVHARKAWGYVSGPWRHISDYWGRTWRGELTFEGWGDFAAVPWLLLVAIFAWRRFGVAYGLYAAAILAAALQGGQIWALGRISLCAIPAYLLLGQWGATRSRLRLLFVGAGLCWLAVSGVRFVNGYHTGS